MDVPHPLIIHSPLYCTFNLMTICLFLRTDLLQPQYSISDFSPLQCFICNSNSFMFFTLDTFPFFSTAFRCLNFGSHKPTLNLRHFSFFRFNILPFSQHGRENVTSRIMFNGTVLQICPRFNKTSNICPLAGRSTELNFWDEMNARWSLTT